MSVVPAMVVAAALAATPPGMLVDRVVAVVDKQVLTQSELLIEARVALALREGGDAAAADLDEPIVRAFLDYVVNQMLVSAQARRLGAEQVAGSEVDREVQRFADLFRSSDAYRAFLRRFDVSEEALRHILERNLRNQRFIADRMRLIGAGDRFADVRSPEYQAALKKWLDELRDTGDVRVLGPTGELELVPKRTTASGGASGRGP